MAYTTINKSTDYFNTKLYTGNGTTDTAITGVGFQPDLTWFKGRTNTENHFLFDAVRGATKRLIPNGTSSEATETNSMKSFDSDGFTLGTMGEVNQNTINYASWNWKANGTGSSNTDGSITSTVSANTTAGFSISQYTGTGSNATVGHGLGSAPNVVFIKKSSGSSQWVFGTTTLGFTKFLELNLTTAAQTNSNRFNDTDPTSSVFSIGTEGDVNSSGGTYIAYCFAEKKGYSKFGKYTGNGNADGTFVFTGFAPAFVMTKRTDSTSDWLICDNKRPGYNVINKKLFPNQSQAEDSYDSFDFVSNGFKIRSSGTGHNASGGTFFYMAFGQSLVGSNNVPTTAR
jgi:hypothetical protein